LQWIHSLKPIALPCDGSGGQLMGVGEILVDYTPLGGGFKQPFYTLNVGASVKSCGDIDQQASWAKLTPAKTNTTKLKEIKQ
jgi:hypothetical protein